MVADFFTHLQDELSIALAFGSIAFVLHIIGYTWYSVEILRGHTRPNAATWMMWLLGAWVEWYTYDAIESHWSTSALPLACLIGVCSVALVTSMLQFRVLLRNEENVIFEPSDPRDYWLVGADIGALIFYFLTEEAFWANFIAVSTTIVTFWPIWKTTLKNGYERPGPWVVWCLAYYFMWLAVLAEENKTADLELQFYPLYYLLLHVIVAVLAFRTPRAWLANLIMPKSKLHPAE